MKCAGYSIEVLEFIVQASRLLRARSRAQAAARRLGVRAGAWPTPVARAARLDDRRRHVAAGRSFHCVSNIQTHGEARTFKPDEGWTRKRLEPGLPTEHLQSTGTPDD